MVIVRDMSRFDREIRFIAAVNDVGSKKPGNGSELLLFLNVMRLPQFRP